MKPRLLVPVVRVVAHPFLLAVAGDDSFRQGFYNKEGSMRSRNLLVYAGNAPTKK